MTRRLRCTLNQHLLVSRLRGNDGKYERLRVLHQAAGACGHDCLCRPAQCPQAHRAARERRDRRGAREERDWFSYPFSYPLVVAACRVRYHGWPLNRAVSLWAVPRSGWTVAGVPTACRRATRGLLIRHNRHRWKSGKSHGYWVCGKGIRQPAQGAHRARGVVHGL